MYDFGVKLTAHLLVYIIWVSIFLILSNFVSDKVLIILIIGSFRWKK